MAFALRTNTMSPNFNDTFLILFGVVCAVRIPVFIRLGLYRSFLRFPSEKVWQIAAQGIAISSMLMGAALYLIDLK
ncbi:MAG: polysaccharide biosynthesis protein, partial [Planctomycetota bacterium]|nr:polysaccharide biosynthesis protein [Planctomycetota bacterium]